MRELSTLAVCGTAFESHGRREIVDPGQEYQHIGIFHERESLQQLEMVSRVVSVGARVGHKHELLVLTVIQVLHEDMGPRLGVVQEFTERGAPADRDDLQDVRLARHQRDRRATQPPLVDRRGGDSPNSRCVLVIGAARELLLGGRK